MNVYVINQFTMRKLYFEDIVHYGKVVTALKETVRLMGEVDGVIDVNGGWPVK